MFCTLFADKIVRRIGDLQLIENRGDAIDLLRKTLYGIERTLEEVEAIVDEILALLLDEGMLKRKMENNASWFHFLLRE